MDEVLRDGRSRIWAALGLALLAPGGEVSAPKIVREFPREYRLADGIQVTGEGSLVVTDPGEGRVVEIAPEGREIRSWGRYGHGAGDLLFPADACAGGERVYVADRFGRLVRVFLRSGEWVANLGDEEGDGRLLEPVAVDLSPAGELLVLDAADGTVKVYTPHGRFLRRFGGQGDGPDRTSCPHDLAVGPDGTIWVADSGNRRVQRFRAEGTPLGPFGRYGDGAGEFRNPTGVAAGPGGVLYVVDHFGNRVQVFDGEGREILARRLDTQEFFRNPSRIAVLPGGRCFLTGPQFGRVAEVRCP